MSEINCQSEFLDRILERPALYGCYSVFEVEAMLRGYMTGRAQCSEFERDELYFGFHDWLVDRYQFGHSQSWSSIIAFMGGSEAGAFQLLKDLWGDYKAGKPAKRGID